jgi:hypothetical protein
VEYVNEVQHLVCERLRKFGFARAKRIRLYGEELHFVGDPLLDHEGFFIEANCRNSGERKKVRIPLSLVHTLLKEISHQESRMTLTESAKTA